MAVDRRMRLPDLDQSGAVTVGELIDAVKAEVMADLVLEVERNVLAELRAMLGQGAPVRPT